MSGSDSPVPPNDGRSSQDWLSESLTDEEWARRFIILMNGQPSSDLLNTSTPLPMTNAEAPDLQPVNESLPSPVSNGDSYNFQLVNMPQRNWGSSNNGFDMNGDFGSMGFGQNNQDPDDPNNTWQSASMPAQHLQAAQFRAQQPHGIIATSSASHGSARQAGLSQQQLQAAQFGAQESDDIRTSLSAFNGGIRRGGLSQQQIAFSQQVQQQTGFPQQQTGPSQERPLPLFQPPSSYAQLNQMRGPQQYTPTPSEASQSPEKRRLDPVPIPRLGSKAAGRPLGPMSRVAKVPPKPKPGRKPMTIPENEVVDRRRTQNRNAQRKFRDKRQQKLLETQEELAELKQAQEQQISEWNADSQERRMENQEIRMEAQELRMEIESLKQSRSIDQVTIRDLQQENRKLRHENQKLCHKNAQLKKTDDSVVSNPSESRQPQTQGPFSEHTTGDCGFCTDEMNCVCEKGGS